jgi:universal stress protein E
MAVLDRSNTDEGVLVKAAGLARRFAARLELFLCDAEHGYALKRNYEASQNEAVRRTCVEGALEYLTRVQSSAALHDVRLTVSAACESPLYEGIARKVAQSRPGLVIKHASGVHSLASAPFDPNDWQLMRRCPTTLLITRGRPWRRQPRFAAAVDVSAEETTGLARSILETMATFSGAYGSQADILYAERGGVAGETREARAAALAQLTQQCRLEGRNIRILDGDPERALPPCIAVGNYDVLVLGALTHRPGASTLVGTLTARLETVDCDFVLVKLSDQ